MKSWKNYINGEWTSSSKKTLAVVNPFTEKRLAEVTDSNEKDIDLAVVAARKAFEIWRLKTPGERALLFLKLADLLEEEKSRLAKIESEQQGKTVSLANLDIEFSIDNLRFYAGACRSLQTAASGTYYSQGTSVVKREPLGVVAAITPWNYPIMMACWKMAAVAAGNTIIFKPSSMTPLTTLELAILSEKAGFPKGVLNVVTGTGESVGRMLAAHSKIDMIALTGNTETGKDIMRIAAATMKKVHFELGGKAPFIVFEDAVLERTAKFAVDASIINSGQDCTAAARVYVQEKIYDEFVQMVKKYAEKIVVGDPSKSSTSIGPLVSEHQKERVKGFTKNLKRTEKIIFQGKIPGKGYFFPVTIIKDFEQSGNLCQNEIFGPVILLAKFKTEEEVIKKANDVAYGLASSIWTEDIQKAMRVANALQFGEVWINDHLPLVSEMPHGGTKQTGHGRDLSIHAIEEYTYLKHVYISLTGDK